MSAKGKAGVHGAEIPEEQEKDGPIDPMFGKNASARGPDPVSSLWVADGRQPFMPCDYLTSPAFNTDPSGSPIARRMRPLSVGRLENAFSSSD